MTRKSVDGRKRFDYVNAMLGYPEDRRSAAQQAKANANILGDVERVAARVVARLTGESITI